MTEPPWCSGEVLEVCQPDLFVTCRWPACEQDAVYEVELSVDGRWTAQQLCQAHYEQLTD